MGINAPSTAMGNVRMGTRAERKWNRKAMLTKLTMMASAMRSRFNVCIDSLISQERSYPVTISTPAGSEGAISLNFAFTPSITLRALRP